MKRFLQWLSVLFIVIFLGGLLSVVAVIYDYKHFLLTPVVLDKAPETFEVKPAQTLNTLPSALAETGILLEKATYLANISPALAKQVSRYYWRYYLMHQPDNNRLVVGEYALKPQMNVQQLVALLRSGRIIAHSVRFIEGETFAQLRNTLQSHQDIAQTLEHVPDRDIISIVQKEVAQAPFDPSLEHMTHPEGLFFPDTYQFSKQSKDVTLLKSAYLLMMKNLETAWHARNTNSVLKNPYELLILASIIEKETGLDSERQKISGVFHRRLAKGMPLQTDPSVIYGLGSDYRGTIYRSDLRRDTPYNTYTRKGLPITPIALPSLASLMAAGQPDDSDALYFVADGARGHIFSATYEAHKKAVDAYRKRLNQAQ